MTEDQRSPKPASPAVAAFLSFVLPGLGQIALGAFQRGVILGLPLVAVIVLGAFLFATDKAEVFGALVKPDVVLGLVALDLLHGLIHLIAVGDAYRLARRRVSRSTAQLRAGAPGLLAILLATTLVIHGGLGALGIQAYNTMGEIYQPPDSSFHIPVGTFEPADTPAPGATPTPFQPTPCRAPSGGGRPPQRPAHRRRPGPAAGTSDRHAHQFSDPRPPGAMFGIRGTCTTRRSRRRARRRFHNLPPNLINALWVYANLHQGLFGGKDAGFRAIAGSVQQLVGACLDGRHQAQRLRRPRRCARQRLDRRPFRMYDPDTRTRTAAGTSPSRSRPAAGTSTATTRWRSRESGTSTRTTSGWAASRWSSRRSPGSSIRSRC
jgi:hypothetical protein